MDLLNIQKIAFWCRWWRPLKEFLKQM